MTVWFGWTVWLSYSFVNKERVQNKESPVFGISSHTLEFYCIINEWKLQFTTEKNCLCVFLFSERENFIVCEFFCNHKQQYHSFVVWAEANKLTFSFSCYYMGYLLPSKVLVSSMLGNTTQYYNRCDITGFKINVMHKKHNYLLCLSWQYLFNNFMIIHIVVICPTLIYISLYKFFNPLLYSWKCRIKFPTELFTFGSWLEFVTYDNTL
jgi:hypothetical protein